MKYCPKCKSEFSDASKTECPACGCPLVGSVGEMETFGWKLLFDAEIRADAEYLVAALSTHNINSRIDEERYFGAGPHAVGVKIGDFEKASAILDETGLAEEPGFESDEGEEPAPISAPAGELVTVAKFESGLAAGELKSYLEMNGIPAVLENEHSPRVIPVGPAIGPVLVKVPASHLAQAATLLNLNPNAAPVFSPEVETKKYGCGIMGIVFIFFAVPITAALHYALGLNPVIAAIIAAFAAAGGVSLIFAEPAKDEFEDEEKSGGAENPPKREEEK